MPYPIYVQNIYQENLYFSFLSGIYFKYLDSAPRVEVYAALLLNFLVHKFCLKYQAQYFTLAGNIVFISYCSMDIQLGHQLRTYAAANCAGGPAPVQ